MANKHWVVVLGLTVIILFFCWSLRTKHCSSLLNQQENDIKQTLSNINKKFFNKKGKILKETSIKIEKNHINQERGGYALNLVPYHLSFTDDTGYVIPHHVFKRILDKTGFSKPFLTYFPHPIREPISEIILGADGQAKKIYITLKNGNIMAVVCKGDVCHEKNYYYKINISIN